MPKTKSYTGMNGPLRTPMAGFCTQPKQNHNPPTGANTTIPGTAPKAAPIRSPLVPVKGGNLK